MSRTARIVRDEGRRGHRRRTPDLVGTAQRTHRGLHRDGDSTFQGVRLDTGDLARPTDGLRSLAGARPCRQNQGREVRGGLGLPGEGLVCESAHCLAPREHGRGRSVISGLPLERTRRTESRPRIPAICSSTTYRRNPVPCRQATANAGGERR